MTILSTSILISVGVLGIVFLIARKIYLRRVNKISDIDIAEFNKEVMGDAKDLNNHAKSGGLSQISFEKTAKEYGLTAKEAQKLEDDMKYNL